jgi:hypothetical protein
VIASFAVASVNVSTAELLELVFSFVSEAVLIAGIIFTARPKHDFNPRHDGPSSFARNTAGGCVCVCCVVLCLKGCARVSLLAIAKKTERMGVIDVVNKYLSLVKKSENRVRIVRDPKTLPTLSVFLQNGDGAVVSKTIEVLELLSQEPQVHAAMREEPSLLTQVAAVVAKYKASLASTSSTASDVVLPTVISPSSAPDAAATPAATPSSDAASTYAATILLGEKIAENLAASSALQASKSESGAACAFTTPVKPVVETIVIPAVVKTEAKVVEPVLNHVLFVKVSVGV